MRHKLIQTWPQEIKDNIDVAMLLEESEDFSFAELEAIRTFLVTNKILGDGNWSLETALEEYHSRSAENKKLGVGFNSNSLKKSLDQVACEAPSLAGETDW